MRSPSTLGRSIALGVIASVCAASPAAAASYNCKGDKKLDIPMQFTAFIESAGRVHLSAFGGADKSGWVAPQVWRLIDATDHALDSFPRTDLGFASQDMLRETTLEGLQPGNSYTLELASIDLCGKVGITRQAVSLPFAGFESSPAIVSTPTVVRVGFQSAVSSMIQFSATDVTGIRRVQVFVDGALISDLNYFDGKNFRWWTDPYPADGVTSSLEGPNFYVMYPDIYRGRYLMVEVVVEDYAGNSVRTSTQLSL